jgi:hypothetical protein
VRIVIAKKLLSAVGGSEAQARALGAALRDRGHAVTLVGLRPAIRRVGIPDAVYDARAGDVTLEDDGLTYRFIASRAGLLEAALPLSLVGPERLAPAHGRDRMSEPRARSASRSSRRRSCTQASRSPGTAPRTSRAIAAMTRSSV